MRHHLATVFLLAISGAPAAAQTAPPPPGAAMLAQRGHDQLWAVDAPRGPEKTDIRHARPMAARVEGRWLVPGTPVLTGALMHGRVAWVGADRVLRVQDVRGEETVVARDVVPELAASEDGLVLAFPREPGPHGGVYTWDGANTVRVTAGMAVADRPLFAGGRRLVVAGAVNSGVAGIWVVNTSASEPRPVAVTNGALRVGKPWGKDFVPPPADHASMKVEGDVLSFFDGERTRSVVLPGGAR